MKTLRVILGDQLSHDITSLKDAVKSEDILLMCEVKQEANYVAHHKKKIAFLFSAMRHFANELRELNFQLIYTELDDPNNAGSFYGEVKKACSTHSIEKIIITHPGEYRVLQDIQSWSKDFNVHLEIREDKRFLCSIQDFSDWVNNRKQLRMEYFYREMRQSHGILMQDDQPIGGEWNYDKKNRKPPNSELTIPDPYKTHPDSITKAVMTLVEKYFPSHFGDLEPFYFAVTRPQALEALKDFIMNRLKNFGDYQDSMLENEPWMYHSHLSFYLNCGLLNPLECIEAAEQAYSQMQAPLNAVEGFIRQILGWREYVRGIYWHFMPEYAEQNYLNAKNELPSLYWTGETELNCLRQCVSETKRHAYAHHIQRLMVLGNFALLTGVDPKYVNEWYLIVYADAYEWVELPNVTGMILYADGGQLASKPYAASGSYINKMSNYCKNCRYKVKLKQGPDACPFNYLYWNFLAENKNALSSNKRLAMIYKTYENMSDDLKRTIREDSQTFLATLNTEIN